MPKGKKAFVFNSVHHLKILSRAIFMYFPKVDDAFEFVIGQRNNLQNTYKYPIMTSMKIKNTFSMRLVRKGKSHKGELYILPKLP